MIRPAFLALFAGLFLAATGSAQVPTWRFQWKTGDVLTYRVEQVTSAAELVDGKNTETTAKLSNLKRWQVLAVDDQGVATVQMSLAALRLETTTPTGEVMLFDSAHPDKGDAQMREQLSKYLGGPLAVLRVDARGRVLEVKESKHGPASRFESELPFVLTLPESGPRENQTWERAYAVTLEPPQGTGEKYKASQKYAVKALRNGEAVVGVTTVLASLPEALADQVPLLQLQPEGEVIFNVAAGRLHRAKMNVNKELKNHQGEGSSYVFRSSYSEEYVGK